MRFERFTKWCDRSRGVVLRGERDREANPFGVEAFRPKTYYRRSGPLARLGVTLTIYFFPWHSKFPASFVSPLPLYFAACGYTHSGRVITACCRSGPVYFEAIIVSGATPFSTHCSRAAFILCVGSLLPTHPNESGPGPPPQCCTPGAMYNRKKDAVSFLPIFLTTLS